jgi:hypothetical protein
MSSGMCMDNSAAAFSSTPMARVATSSNSVVQILKSVQQALTSDKPKYLLLSLKLLSCSVNTYCVYYNFTNYKNSR